MAGRHQKIAVDLKVTILKGEDLRDRDIVGHSDGYCDVVLCEHDQRATFASKKQAAPYGRIGVTKTVMDSLNPVWNETLFFRINDPNNPLDRPGIHIECQDQDPYKKSQFLGECKFDLDGQSSGGPMKMEMLQDGQPFGGAIYVSWEKMDPHESHGQPKPSNDGGFEESKQSASRANDDLWVDADFPPNDRSVGEDAYGLDDDGTPIKKEVIWLRPHEFGVKGVLKEVPTLFYDGSEVSGPAPTAPHPRTHAIARSSALPATRARARARADPPTDPRRRRPHALLAHPAQHRWPPPAPLPRPLSSSSPARGELRMGRSYASYASYAAAPPPRPRAPTPTGPVSTPTPARCAPPRSPCARAQAGDVVQGQLGDCYLLGAMSAVSMHPDDIIEHLFLDERDTYDGTDEGHVRCRVYKNGAWMEIKVDTLIPCFAESREPIFARNMALNELWVVFLATHNSILALPRRQPARFRLGGLGLVL